MEHFFFLEEVNTIVSKLFGRCSMEDSNSKGFSSSIGPHYEWRDWYTGRWKREPALGQDDVKLVNNTRRVWHTHNF